MIGHNPAVSEPGTTVLHGLRGWPPCPWRSIAWFLFSSYIFNFYMMFIIIFLYHFSYLFDKKKKKEIKNLEFKVALYAGLENQISNMSLNVKITKSSLSRSFLCGSQQEGVTMVVLK